ncbi:achaete-scute homolog 3 [Rhineura floridana]|uniref:achaete-scute homolog 3 n=1 Tax=Rhineura floridana TaxID=261503 RepID=UPI002AC85C8C|nr:achaete-scute homolog 3 [Rhineura floridana]
MESSDFICKEPSKLVATRENSSTSPHREGQSCQKIMALSISWDAMERLPIFSDSHVGQMSRFGCRDPFATFHLYPETTNQFTGPEDLPLLSFTPEQLTAENFYRDPCGFPFQGPCGNFGRCQYSCSPAFIRKRNERERQRVKCVNEGYAKLRHHLPAEYLEKRLSKVETLRAAIKYIQYLQSVLYNDSEEDSREAHHSSEDSSQSNHVPRTS